MAARTSGTTPAVGLRGGPLIAVDWGTTNRRAWRIGSGGAVEDELDDALGVTAVAAGGFGAAVADLRTRLGDLPMLLAGMIGSDRGWQEAPYVPCPAGPLEVARAILWVDRGRTGIVPGLSRINGAADVMRGEEVQLFGAVASGAAHADPLFCHPGTHAKWVEMSGARISRFATSMTGELFALLRAHSILAPQLAGEARDGPAFRAGVADGLGGAPLAAALFGVRARDLLGKTPAGDGDDGASYASGLLIGADVAGGLALGPAGAPVCLVGRPDLCALYAAALDRAGRVSHKVDGQAAFLAGIAELVRHID